MITDTHEEFDQEEFDREEDRFRFTTHRMELQDSEQYDDPTIYAMLLEFNKHLKYPLNDGEVAEVTHSLKLQPQEPQGPMQSELLAQAIKEHDKAALLTDGNITYIAAMKRLSPLSYAITMDEIKAAFSKELNLRDFNRSISHAERNQQLADTGEQLDIADVARNWASSHRDTWGYDTNVDAWRMWNCEHWKEQTRKHFLDQEAVGALQDSSHDITSLASINCFERLAEAYCLRDFAPAPSLINFANGTLNRTTGQMQTFSKDDNLTYCLPYSYNPHGTHPNIDKFLAEVLPDEYARQALMAHGGLALSGDMLMHFFLALIGAGRSGKSTILALINALCGATDPHSFAGHSIFSRDIEGKRSRFKWSQRSIACIDELPQEALREEELLKAMSAHSGVEMRGIGKDEHLNNRWKPKLLMATNEQPRYRDTSSAIKERAVFAEITKARPKEQRDAKLLTDKLLPEIGAFAASCLELAKQVLDRGYYPLSAEMKQLIDRIANEGNPLKDFVHVCCVLDPMERIATSELHSAYKDYCNEQGYKDKYILAFNTMSLALRTMNIGVTGKDHPIRINGKLQRGLYGIRLRTVDDPDPKPKYEHDESLTRPTRMKMYTVSNGENKETVDGLNRLVEQRENGMYTMYTVKDSNSEVHKDIYTQQEQVEYIYHPIQESSEKQLYTPYTPDVNEPVERDKHVNGHKNGNNGTVYIKPDFPCQKIHNGKICNNNQWIWSPTDKDHICAKCWSPAHKEVIL